MHERTRKLRLERSKPLWEIKVPTHDNEQNQFSIDHHRQWDKRVLEISGGLTINKVSRGRWENDKGEQFWESMIPVQISCTRAKIKRVALMTKSHYSQEKVMYHLVSEKPCFI